MTTKTKNIMKKILAYALMCIVLMLVYVVVSFLFDWLFDLIGEEKSAGEVRLSHAHSLQPQS